MKNGYFKYLLKVITTMYFVTFTMLTKSCLYTIQFIYTLNGSSSRVEGHVNRIENGYIFYLTKRLFLSHDG